MAHIEQHCYDCLEILGKEFKEVHEWLDEFFFPEGGSCNVFHRKFRHHQEGLNEIKTLFGKDAVVAGVIHILRDCPGIAKDIEDYVNGDFTQWKYYGKLRDKELENG